jgi:hypothetical protein
LIAAGCGTAPAATTSDAPGACAHEHEVVLDGGGLVPEHPDGVAACPPGECNYQTGTGCPADTPSCQPVLTGAGIEPSCEKAGTATSYEACAASTECATGYMCAQSVCRKLCCGRDWTGCPGPEEHCLQVLEFGDGNGGVIPTGAMLCYPVNNCDPLDPVESCPTPGYTCQLVDPRTVACMPENPGGQGDPCPCRGGFTCVGDGDGARCRRLCRAEKCGDPPYCEPGEGVCVHLDRDPDIVGECTPK